MVAVAEVTAADAKADADTMRVVADITTTKAVAVEATSTRVVAADTTTKNSLHLADRRTN